MKTERRTTTPPIVAESCVNPASPENMERRAGRKRPECPIGEVGPPQGITKRVKRGPIQNRKPARVETPSRRSEKGKRPKDKDRERGLDSNRDLREDPRL